MKLFQNKYMIAWMIFFIAAVGLAVSQSSNFLSIGDNVSTTDKSYCVNRGGSNRPCLRWNATDSAWEFSDDGQRFVNLSASGATGTFLTSDTTLENPGLYFADAGAGGEAFTITLPLSSESTNHLYKITKIDNFTDRIVTVQVQSTDAIVEQSGRSVLLRTEDSFYTFVSNGTAWAIVENLQSEVDSDRAVTFLSDSSSITRSGDYITTGTSSSPSTNYTITLSNPEVVPVSDFALTTGQRVRITRGNQSDAPRVFVTSSQIVGGSIIELWKQGDYVELVRSSSTQWIVTDIKRSLKLWIGANPDIGTSSSSTGNPTTTPSDREYLVPTYDNRSGFNNINRAQNPCVSASSSSLDGFGENFPTYTGTIYTTGSSASSSCTGSTRRRAFGIVVRHTHRATYKICAGGYTLEGDNDASLGHTVDETASAEVFLRRIGNLLDGSIRTIGVLAESAYDVSIASFCEINEVIGGSGRWIGAFMTVRYGDNDFVVTENHAWPYMTLEILD